MVEEIIAVLCGKGGGGTREAAIVEALLTGNCKVISVGATNPQILEAVDINVDEVDLERLVEKLWELKVTIIVPGPEDSLILGSDLEKRGFLVAGPSKDASFIELNKARAIKFWKKIGLKSYLPKSKIFRGWKDVGKALALVEKWYPDGLVVKPSRTRNGKGAKISDEHFTDIDDVKLYVRELLEEKQSVVIQKKVSGIEFVIQAIVDKYGHIKFLPVVFDWKRRFAGDRGPNTGSTGSFTGGDGNLLFVSEQEISEARCVMKQTVLGLKFYKGIIYGQFMRTRKGIVIIEFNARFGDPEACNVLPSLDIEKGANFAQICRAVVDGTLNKIRVECNPEPNLVKCVFHEKYPGESEPFGFKINTTEFPVKMYFGRVVKKPGAGLFTTNSRAFVIRAEGRSVPEAAEITNKAIEEIFAGQLGKNMLDYRPDIGTIEHINAIEKLKLV